MNSYYGSLKNGPHLKQSKLLVKFFVILTMYNTKILTDTIRIN